MRRGGGWVGALVRPRPRARRCSIARRPSAHVEAGSSLSAWGAPLHHPQRRCFLFYFRPGVPRGTPAANAHSPPALPRPRPPRAPRHPRATRGGVMGHLPIPSAGGQARERGASTLAPARAGHEKKTAGAWAQQQRGGRRPPHPRPTPVRAHPLPEQGASEDGTPSPCPRPSSSVFFTWPPMTTMEGSIDQSEGRLESAVPALSPSRVAAPCRRLTSWTTDCMPSAMVGRGGAERGVCVRKKWEGARGRGQDPGARKKKG